MEIADQTGAGKQLAMQAMGYLREHSEEKFSLSAVAGALYVNGSYLARVFKRETGHTLLWAHHTLRCEKAKKMLKETSLSVAEISSEVGYVSPAHFSHQFKKITGIAPKNWRTIPADTR